ncbi:hypothetical protein NLU14_08505 [Marinobacter sp. 71-i]|uniref:Uncharacterized protein n=1 Tax=Marinobacter iranensis TaxID=2962607 RepID=A0ABT5Y9B3_9GAMM|nr:hypothetical protein [Marinobacter iranensis]MDF0750269.1 hypothetical protein [Marinobacter iranensis]
MCDFWAGIILAVIIVAASVAWKRVKAADEFSQMSWMDWCGRFALQGVGVIFLGGIFDWMPLMAAGVFMVCSLYLIAILGLLGRFDEMISEIVRAIRRR